MVIFYKKQYPLKSIYVLKTAVLSAVVLILLTISTVAVRAAESSLRATPVKLSPAPASIVSADVAVTPQPVVPTPAPVAVVIARKIHAISMMTGNASWYGSVLQGHKTASGEIFDEHLLTAAHRTLPFGTMVQVTDLRNHRSVIVKITDRGQLFADRAIDLSYAAADQLHMVRDGVHPVRLTVIPKNDPSLASWTPESVTSQDLAGGKAE
jgi:rare lipoprotein A